jgi:hypothetical protein
MTAPVGVLAGKSNSLQAVDENIVTGVKSLVSRVGLWVRGEAEASWGLPTNERGHVLIPRTDSQAEYSYDVRVNRHRTTENGRFVSQKDMPYPESWGFKWRMEGELPPGKIIDRFGSPTGRFAGKPGASISERGLPPGTENAEYHQYEILKTVKAEIGPAKEVKEFKAQGGAEQYLFKRSLVDLEKDGFIRKIK